MPTDIVEVLAENERLKSQLNQLSSAGKEAAIDSAITQSLAGYDLNPGAGAQLTMLLRQDAAVHEEGGRFIVTGPGLRPVPDMVRDQLAKPEFSHFLRQQPAAATAPVVTVPQTWEERSALAQQGVTAWVDVHAAARQAAPAADPRKDMSVPFGLGGRQSATPQMRDAGRKV
jgi:hypothetical protein